MVPLAGHYCNDHQMCWRVLPRSRPSLLSLPVTTCRAEFPRCKFMFSGHSRSFPVLETLLLTPSRHRISKPYRVIENKTSMNLSAAKRTKYITTDFHADHKSSDSEIIISPWLLHQQKRRPRQLSTNSPRLFKKLVGVLGTPHTRDHQCNRTRLLAR